MVRLASATCREYSRGPRETHFLCDVIGTADGACVSAALIRMLLLKFASVLLRDQSKLVLEMLQRSVAEYGSTSRGMCVRACPGGRFRRSSTNQKKER